MKPIIKWAHIVAVRLALLVAVALLIGAVLGGIIGATIGWRSAFHEMDGASEIVFDSQRSDPVPTEFWVAAFDANDNPKLVTLSSETDLEEPWSVRLPSGRDRSAIGPWEGDMPIGEHSFDAGGMTQTQCLSAERDFVQLVLYPSDVEGGWRRFYYEYEIESGLVIPRLLRRERMYNGFGLMQAMGSAGIGARAGATIGFGSLLLGSVIFVLAVPRRKA